MCQLAAPPSADPVDLLLYDLHGAESRLTDLTVKRRRDRVVEPVVKRIAADLRYVFQHESERVLDLMAQATLPYESGQSSEAAISNVDALMRLILNGQDINQYQAVLEDGYRTVMPGAMDMTLKETLDAAGIKYRVGPTGDLFMLNGMKLTRFAGAEQWILDHSIQFSRRWASKVPARTNLAIRNTLSDGMAKFEDMMELRKRVRNVYAAAKSVRSEMIARTETSRAYNSATVETGVRLGLQKYWISSGSPYAEVDVCGENADMGLVDMQQVFNDLNGLPIDGPPAHVNCFLHHSIPVATESGDKSICDIEVGDKVLTHSGRYQRVSHVMQSATRYHGPAVRIRFMGRGKERNTGAVCRNSVTVTPEHPFLTERGWIPASELTAADSLYVRAGGAQFVAVKPLALERIENFHGEKRYNIEVENDHSYVAKGIVTHNCECSLGLDVPDDYELPGQFTEE